MTKVPKQAQCPPDCHACALRALPAFEEVAPAVLDSIEAARSHAINVNAGSVLIHEGQRSTQLYTLYAGWAFRYKTLPDGRRQILNFVLPGDLIGLQQEFDGKADHGVDMLTDCALCVFKNDALWGLYRDQPRMGYGVTWIAAHQERHVDSNLVSAGQRTALESVAMLLLHLYQRLQRIDEVDGDGSVRFPLTQQHIADALGLSLVHTNKTLRRLSALGLHELKNGRLRMLNTRALARIAEYYDRPPRLLPLL